MTSTANFNAVLSRIATHLISLGFKRKGAWFTKRPFDDQRFWCINVRKIPQVASKRIVFQVVAYAGQTAPGDHALISSLDQVHAHAALSHHIVDGNAEVVWTVWPSSKPEDISQRVIAAIAGQSIPALQQHRFDA